MVGVSLRSSQPVAITRCPDGTRRLTEPKSQVGRSVSTGRPDPEIGVRPARNSEAFRFRYLGVFPKSKIAFRAVVIRTFDSLAESRTSGRHGICGPRNRQGRIAFIINHGSCWNSSHIPDDWHVRHVRCQTRIRRKTNLRQSPYIRTYLIIGLSVISIVYAWDMRGGGTAVPAMPFKPVSATLFKTSQKPKFLKGRIRPALRLDLDWTVVRSVAATAIRHTDAMISTGANAGKKWSPNGAARQ